MRWLTGSIVQYGTLPKLRSKSGGSPRSRASKAGAISVPCYVLTISDTRTLETDTSGTAIAAALTRAKVIDALHTVYDPEIPVNIYDLGLVYRVDLVGPAAVAIDMTLTAPSCPVAGHMPGMVRSMVARVEGIEEVTVELVWEPAWTPERLFDFD